MVSPWFLVEINPKTTSPKHNQKLEKSLMVSPWFFVEYGLKKMVSNRQNIDSDLSREQYKAIIALENA